MKNMKQEKKNKECQMGNIDSANWRTISKPASEQSNHPITPAANGQRQVGGLRVGFGRDGPPGRARSPGTGNFPFRDHPPDGPYKSDHPPDG
jgi:hypothetical protein